MKKRIISVLKENKSFLLFILLMFVFRSAFADWSEVPTGSMKPTILEGDRIFVNKMAYDIRVPFSHISLIKLADPSRGDIIVFDSEVSEKRLVKRVVGIPGDIVQMTDNVLAINGQQLTYTDIDETAATIDRLEDLLGVEHKVRVRKTGSFASSFRPVIVPDGYYIALGDNRDNSGDSRMIGFIPRKEIVGRTSTVVLSFNYDNYYIPRKGRYFQTL